MMTQQSSLDNYLWPNRYTLTFLGLWPMRSNANNIFKLFAYFRIFLAIFFLTSVLVPEILTIIIYWGDISILAGVGCIMNSVGQCLFKVVYVVVRHKKFHGIHRSIKTFWLISDKKKEREVFEELPKLAKQWTIILFITATCNIFTIMSASTIGWINNYRKANGSLYRRNLPLDHWYGVDTQQTPNFEIIYTTQFLMLLVGVTSFVGFDATMMTCILHICGQFRLVQARFRALGERVINSWEIGTNIQIILDSSKKKISQYVQHHQNTIRFAQELNDLLNPVICVQLVLSGVTICLSGYALIIGTEDRETITRNVIYVITIFSQLVVWGWPGQLLLEESSAVGHAIYHEIPWYHLSPDQKRDLSYMILRTQKECQITGLGFQVMSLRKLTDVFNTAASYFALLRKVSENEYGEEKS